ncbi:MAG TPA: tetratricopeptide repeat protein [Candidatus Dormibacteraeota bacterium]|nr:tetratricopeptide repeat protein [Candidatus Dormibacteraeota bacterium]
MTQGGPELAENTTDMSGKATIYDLPPGNYIVEASAAGYLEVREDVHLEMRWSLVTIALIMKPDEMGLPKKEGASAAPILAPNARKEVQKGLEAFEKSNLVLARKHFENALAMAPGNPDVQFLMGALEAQEKNFTAADQHLEKAIQIYPNHARSLQLLGELYNQQDRGKDAVPLLEKAVALQDGSWRSHWALGVAYLKTNEPRKALQQADRAITLGKGAAGVAHLLEAQALIDLRQFDAAETSLQAFIRDDPANPYSPKAHAALDLVHERQKDELTSMPLAISDTRRFVAIADLNVGVTPSKDSIWAQPGIDDSVPSVSPSVSCSSSQVIGRVGKQVEELMSSLEKFSATERVNHFTVDKQGGLRAPQIRSFEYVVSVKQLPHGLIALDEYRDGSLDPSQFPASIATNGLPAMALVFHPQMSSDFNFVCEGMGQVSGSPAWQVHFQQKPDRPSRIHAYVIAGNYHSVPLKGRAWIDAATYQLARLEFELVKPMPEIHLLRERVSIDYAPVQFRSRDVQLWLPSHADLLISRDNKAFFRTHSFSNFQLFSVGTGQQLQVRKESYSFKNLTDGDVSGQLTITPKEGSALSSVSITFTIPARQVVIKLVGSGKDLNISPESIGSARFVYSGSPGAVQADAMLTRESTLEVVPEFRPLASAP